MKTKLTRHLKQAKNKFLFQSLSNTNRKKAAVFNFETMENSGALVFIIRTKEHVNNSTTPAKTHKGKCCRNIVRGNGQKSFTWELPAVK